ncbi:MAG: hypothetical protein B7Z31_10060 [Rhodobacterales bacterium 12-65-15]|nr:MAG: hypothetical protein B7Z31_10060 [Rhodobacterales bacterium 12-65-15]
MSEIFKTRVPKRPVAVVGAIAAAAAARNVSSTTIGAEILRLGTGRQRLSLEDYFLYGAHVPGKTKVERDEFLGDTVMLAMNKVLTPLLGGFFGNKLLVDQVLTRSGVAVAGTRAVAAVGRLHSACEVLRSPPEIMAFLIRTPLPFFGKPCNGTRSIGAVSVVGRDGERLTLGDGSRITVAEFAREITALFPNGYIFQDLMVPHPDLARIVGPVIASVRIVTVRARGDILPLYSAMKMPGKGQMVDDIVSVINTMCAVDLTNGRILRGQDACQLGGTPMPLQPVTGLPLARAELPLWPKTVQLAIDTHAPFLRQGLLATDIAITPDGPKVIEVNSYPLHGFYQKCFNRGFWNADIAPIMTQALAEFGHHKATRALRYP